MSHQTKQQSIGYILKSTLGSHLPSNEIIDIVRLSKIIVEDRDDITNEDTIGFWNKISEKLALDESIEIEIRKELYYLFDIKTVEESEDYFESFTTLYPFLKKD